MLAAASQRTSSIELGTAVTPLAWENPLRLAEDLATVDVHQRSRFVRWRGGRYYLDAVRHRLGDAE